MCHHQLGRTGGVVAVYAVLVLLLLIRTCQSQQLQQVQQQPQQPADDDDEAQQTRNLGAYLGCFQAQHVTTLVGIRETAGGPFTTSSLYLCPGACKEGNYSITAISPELRCWCGMATPDLSQQLPDSACGPGELGSVAVFYHHDYASNRKCQVVHTPLTPDDTSVDYNPHNVEFPSPSTPPPAASNSNSNSDSDSSSASMPAQMRIQMQGSSGARVRPKADPQMYGQFEVTAKVDSAAGAVTAFYVRDSDEYNADNTGEFEEIDVEFLNARPGVPNSVWLNSYHRGLSRGELLVKPEAYQQLLNLSADANTTNTWLTYTINWQPSHVAWAINGVPVLKRTSGQVVRWSDMNGREFERIFVSPDKRMHISFSMWSDSSRFHFGGELDNAKSPFNSFFKDLRRIVCGEPIAANDTQAFGPAWMLAERGAWPVPPPSPSPAPAGLIDDLVKPQDNITTSPSPLPVLASLASEPAANASLATFAAAPAAATASVPAAAINTTTAAPSVTPTSPPEPLPTMLPVTGVSPPSPQPPSPAAAAAAEAPAVVPALPSPPPAMPSPPAVPAPTNLDTTRQPPAAEDPPEALVAIPTQPLQQSYIRPAAASSAAKHVAPSSKAQLLHDTPVNTVIQPSLRPPVLIRQEPQVIPILVESPVSVAANKQSESARKSAADHHHRLSLEEGFHSKHTGSRKLLLRQVAANLLAAARAELAVGDVGGLKGGNTVNDDVPLGEALAATW